MTARTAIRLLRWLPALGIACLLGGARPVAERPNILLIMADDMGFECVSANGAKSYATPRLDRLATEGIRFVNCHSQPICTPSRVQIMTGIYNNRNYIRFGILDPKATTFGNILKKAGYATAIAGKWQLLGGLDGPHHFGFDEYCLWQLTRRPSRYVNPGLEINGELKDWKDGTYGPDVTSDFICDFMERKKDGPFFAYYPMILPHWPFEPTPDSPDYDKTSKGLPGKGKNEYFDDMVAYVDKLVGKLLDKLEALGIREKTLVVFTGDNGTYTGITSMLGDRKYPGGKGGTKDNGTHVPLIVSWPGTTPKGRVSDVLFDFSDVLPTLADVAGAEIPGELGLKGKSIGPLLRGEDFTGREVVYCWYERNGKRGSEKQLTRDRTYKLYSDGKFFDVVKDFYEKTPLDPSVATEVHAKLKAVLDAEMKVTEKATAEMKARGLFKPQKKKKKK